MHLPNAEMALCFWVVSLILLSRCTKAYVISTMGGLLLQFRIYFSSWGVPCASCGLSLWGCFVQPCPLVIPDTVCTFRCCATGHEAVIEVWKHIQWTRHKRPDCYCILESWILDGMIEHWLVDCRLSDMVAVPAGPAIDSFHSCEEP